MQLPFVTPPANKVRKVGNDTVGVLEIKSIGALTAPETEYFEKNRVDAGRHLLKMARDAMRQTGRKYTWDDVRSSIGSYALSSELKIEELEKSAAEFDAWYSENTAKNNAIAAISILRNRVAGCESMELVDFNNESLINPGLRAALVEFAINESNGWPSEKDASPAEAEKAPTEEEAAK